MRRLLIILFLSVSGLFFTGCGQKQSVAEITLDLAKTVPIGSLKPDFDIALLGNLEGEFSVEEKVFSHAFFCPCDEGSIFVLGKEVYRVSLPTGKILAQYGHAGRGPNEYLTPIICRRFGEEVFIEDLHGKQVVFTLDGTPLREEANERTVTVMPLAPNRFLRMYPVGHPKGYLYDIVDASGSVLRSSSISLPETGDTPITYLQSAEIVDGQVCVRPNLMYTLYRISEQQETPWIHFDLGPYEMPLEYMWDLDLKRTKTDQYIARDDFSFTKAGDLIFVNYYMAGRHFVIMDLKSGEILFNIKVASEDDPVMGIPLKDDDKTWYVWPAYADENVIIFRDVYDEKMWLFSR